MASSTLRSNPPWHSPTRRPRPISNSPYKVRTCSNNGCRMEACAMDRQHTKGPCTRRRRSFLRKDPWETTVHLQDKLRGHKHLSRRRIRAFKARSMGNKRLHPISISIREAQATPVPLPSCKINISTPKPCRPESKQPRLRPSPQLPKTLAPKLLPLNQTTAPGSTPLRMADSLICRPPHI